MKTMKQQLLHPHGFSMNATTTLRKPLCTRILPYHASPFGPRAASSASSSSSSSSSGIGTGTGTETFAKPLSSIYPPAPCRFCKGAGTVPCSICGGKGVLAKGGFHANNRVDLTRIIGSKWTAMEPTFGWRHFECASKQKQGKDWFLQLVATCDQNTQFWVNSQNLKDRERWSMGWLQRETILERNEKATPCKSCRGMGMLSCDACEHKDNKAEIINV